MPCLNPVTISRRGFTGYGPKHIQVPCGHCDGCTFAFQDMWRIRLKETSSRCAEKGFIYDTLTVRDDAMHIFDYSSVRDGYDSWEGDFINPTEESLKILEHYNFRVPYLPKDVITRWIKQGRDRYNKRHKKAIKLGDVKPLRVRYFGCLEYGPLWQRPHIHIMLYDISYNDYVEFFAKPWRDKMGFTKTKFVKGREDGAKVASYVSKYIIKSFSDSAIGEELPLLRDGFLPYPYRIISHGIGKELLESTRYSALARYIGLSKEQWDNYNSFVVDLDNPLHVAAVTALAKELSGYAFAHPTDFYHFESALYAYYDGKYRYNLPKYYRDKLLNSYDKTLLSMAISAVHLKKMVRDDYSDLVDFVAVKEGISRKDVLRRFRTSEIYFTTSDRAYRSMVAKRRFAAVQRKKLMAKNRVKKTHVYRQLSIFEQ